MLHWYQKTQNFMLISNSKNSKKRMRKKLSAKKLQKIKFFTFITVRKSFRPSTSFGIFSFCFFQRIPTQHQNKRQTRKMDGKKTKNVFYKCVLDSRFPSISFLEGTIFSQKSPNGCTLLRSHSSVLCAQVAYSMLHVFAL